MARIANPVPCQSLLKAQLLPRTRPSRSSASQVLQTNLPNVNRGTIAYTNKNISKIANALACHSLFKITDCWICCELENGHLAFFVKT